MVSENIIRKTLNDIIIKHSEFLYNIEATLRDITDTKEEYKILHDDIWKFWKETKSSDHENLIMKGTDGTFFENKNGDKDSVGKTHEMKEFIKESWSDGEKILYTMHNHPSGACLASLGDMMNMGIVLEKYKVILSKNGLFIAKRREDNVVVGDIIDSYNMMDKKLMRDFDKKYNKDCHELEEKYPRWFDDETTDFVNFHRDYDALFRKSINEHTDEYVDLLNKKLHSKSRNVGIDCYHVPRNFQK